MTEFYSSADNLVGLIYGNFRAIGFEQISRHSILTRRNITQKNFFGAPSPVAVCKLQAKRANLDHADLTANFFWLPAKKTKYTGMKNRDVHA